ncbi:MAG TPA: arylformamidase [Thermoanaerobaculia bacterium]|jgi:arylformamidase|nr:arylformamidase [Thermoanaerobaculia bacterium]
MTRIIDISPLIDPAIHVWPGDTPYSRAINLDMNAGANITLSAITTTVHVGAHTDAPNHYVANGADISERSLDYYLGPCVVITAQVERGERIMHVDKEKVTAKRVLLRTNTFPDPRNWNNDFASLSPELVDALHELGVILIGIDTPSVDPFDSKALEAHNAFARHDMATLEGIVLGGVEDGEYELIALPLKLKHADASPVRAVLRGM